MREARHDAWSLDEFLVWEALQEHRYEFVGGEAFMMAGGTQAHALIVTNLISLLRPILRGSSCRPCGSHLRIPIPPTGNARYPDVTIDCGRFDPAAHDASEPTIVFEVLSKSTGWYDQTRKLKDYEAVASIPQYVCISQSEARISVWRRDDEGRLAAGDDLIDAGQSLALLGVPALLSMTDIYEGTGLLV